MADEKKYITRQEIADLLEMSVWQVRTQERRLGIDRARRDINQRVIRYLRAVVFRELLSRNLIEKA